MRLVWVETKRCQERGCGTIPEKDVDCEKKCNQGRLETKGVLGPGEKTGGNSKSKVGVSFGGGILRRGGGIILLGKKLHTHKAGGPRLGGRKRERASGVKGRDVGHKGRGKEVKVKGRGST